MKIILIAALNKKRVIGKNGKTPWHISEDLQRFKQLTTNHTVLMGRKTFESIGKPLPNRKNIVITRNEKFYQNAETFPSIESALAAHANDEKIFVIGGGEIFQQTIDRADELLLTFVENEDDGDTFFPKFDHLIGSRFHKTNEVKTPQYSFVDFSR